MNFYSRHHYLPTTSVESHCRLYLRNHILELVLAVTWNLQSKVNLSVRCSFPARLHRKKLRRWTTGDILALFNSLVTPPMRFAVVLATQRDGHQTTRKSTTVQTYEKRFRRLFAMKKRHLEEAWSIAITVYNKVDHSKLNDLQSDPRASSNSYASKDEVQHRHRLELLQPSSRTLEKPLNRKREVINGKTIVSLKEKRENCAISCVYGARASPCSAVQWNAKSPTQATSL